jgi:hypothetical protein
VLNRTSSIDTPDFCTRSRALRLDVPYLGVNRAYWSQNFTDQNAQLNVRPISDMYRTYVQFGYLYQAIEAQFRFAGSSRSASAAERPSLTA